MDVCDGSNYAVVMPKMSGREIHDAYVVKSRLTEFPKAKYRFLITVAYNLCVALNEIHTVGAVVGDFNQRNILVSPDGTVKFLDCDSFQIRTPSGEVFGCPVGVPDYLAPELHVADLESVIRTPNQDNFTLAVFIFQLLFLGRHPFQGIGGPDELGECIKRHLYAYGRAGKSAGIRQPDYVLQVDAVTPVLVDLFECAFDASAVHGSRPNAIAWASALKTMLDQVVQCSVNPSHEFHPGRAKGCPFCAIYSKFQTSYFLVDNQHPFRIEASTFSELVTKLAAWQPPELGIPNESHFKFPSLKPRTFPAELEESKGGLFSALGNWWNSSERAAARLQVRKNLESELRNASNRLQAELSGLAAITTSYQKQIADAKVALRSNWTRYQDLPNERKRRIDALFKQFEQLQRDQFLDTQYIARANIPGFGRTRMTRLSTYGIETALDIKSNMRVPGIGEGLTSQLIAWKNQVAQRFVFNPKQQMDPKEIQKIDVSLMSLKFELEKYFKQFEAHLKDVHRANNSLVQSHEPVLVPLAKVKAQAKLNWDTFSRLYPV